MYSFPSFSFKKEDVYVTVIPHLAIACITDKPYENVVIDDKTYRHITHIYTDIEKSQIKVKPTKLFLVTNLSCDGRCKYCYEDHALKTKDIKLTVESLERKLQELEIETIRNVIIYGGEPFLEDSTFDIIYYLRHEKQVPTVHVVTSLFYDDNRFLKVLNFCQQNQISLTISMDPPSKSYPRIYRNVRDVYTFLLKRIQILSYNTNIIFGIRSTISDYAYDGYQQFIDVNNVAKNPVSINFDVIKGQKISFEKLSYFLTTWCSKSDEIISKLLNKTHGTIFASTFNSLLRGMPLLHIMKNCDGGRGRICITPNLAHTYCNEDVTGKTYVINDYSTIFPYDSECNSCIFKYSCGYHCFSVDKQTKQQMCIFRTTLFMESLKQFIKLKSLDEIQTWIEKQPVQLNL